MSPTKKQIIESGLRRNDTNVFGLEEINEVIYDAMWTAQARVLQGADAYDDSRRGMHAAELAVLIQLKEYWADELEREQYAIAERERDGSTPCPDDASR